MKDQENLEMLPDLKSQLREIYRLTEIPIELYQDGVSDPLVSCPEMFFHPNMARIFSAFWGIQKSGTWSVTPEFFYFGTLRITGTNLTIYLGPITFAPVTIEQCHSALLNICETGDRTSEFYRWILDLPPITLQSFTRTITYLNYVFNHIENGSCQYIPILSKEPETIHGPVPQNQLSGDLTDMVMEWLRAGKTKMIEQWVSHINDVGFNMPEWSVNMVRGFRNILIYATVLSSYVARQAGVPSSRAGVITDHYLKKVETLDDYYSLYGNYCEMMIRFTKEVEALSLPPDIPSDIRQICRCILSDPKRNFSLTDVAEIVNKDPSYVSRRFKKYMGMTVTEFVRRQKIKEAQYLIRTSKKSFADIAEELGFPNRSYFQRVYKQVMGEPPGSTRNKKT